MDLKHHLLRQMAFSHATFGPGQRTEGVIDHIKKELDEVLSAGKDDQTEEWVDVVILALDGLTRNVAYFTDDQRTNPQIVIEVVCSAIIEKQCKNESRRWPDWRTTDPNKAIEHEK